METNFPKYYPSDSIHKFEKKVRNTIIGAARQFIGKKKVTQDNKCWFTPPIKEVIKERNQHRSHW